MKEILHNIFKGLCMTGQSITVCCFFILSGIHLYRALSAAGISAILYFIGFVVVFAIGNFGLWVIGMACEEGNNG